MSTITNDVTLTYTASRTVTADEVRGMIGEASYMPWWESFGFEVNHVVVRCWDPNGPEGEAMIDVCVTYQQVVDAVSKAQKHISRESWVDMTGGSDPDLGYADAIDADVVLQTAVYGEIIYG